MKAIKSNIAKVLKGAGFPPTTRFTPTDTRLANIATRKATRLRGTFVWNDSTGNTEDAIIVQGFDWSKGDPEAEAVLRVSFGDRVGRTPSGELYVKVEATRRRAGSV